MTCVMFGYMLIVRVLLNSTIKVYLTFLVLLQMLHIIVNIITVTVVLSSW